MRPNAQPIQEIQMPHILTRAAIAISALGACSSTPVSAEPQSYTLDGEHTHIVWKVDRFGFANTVGSFTEISGSLILDEDDPAASSVTAEIALSGLRSDHAEREEIIRGPFWLDAEQHPVIQFRSTDVHLRDGERCPSRCAHVVGEMTLKGATAPLTLSVELNKIGTDPVTKAQAAGFVATGSFDRADFGVSTALGPIGGVVSFEIHALAIAAD